MNPESSDSNTLNPQEKAVLVECETTLTKYEHSPFEAGRALQRIREERLYRELFPNFDAYCEEKWDLSRSTADRLIGAHIVYKLLAPIGVIVHCESQTRPLIGLRKKQIIAAGLLAVSISGGKRLTARHFQLAAEQVRPAGKRPLPRASTASAKSVAKVLTLISQAKVAVMEDDHGKLLEVLAAIEACLVPPNASPAASQIGYASGKAPDPGVNPATAPATASGQPLTAAAEKRPTAPSAAKDKLASAAEQTNGKAHTKVVHPEVTKPKLAPAPANGSESQGGNHQAARPALLKLGPTQQPIARWNEVPVIVAGWLLAQGQALPGIACIKRSPRDFPPSARIKQLRNDWFIDVGDSRHQLLRNARLLLDKSGYRGLPVAVTLTNRQTLVV